MSTQKWEHRQEPSWITERAVARQDCALAGGKQPDPKHEISDRPRLAGAPTLKRRRHVKSAGIVLQGLAGTAPFRSIVWSIWAWWVTEFLQMVQPIRQAVQPECAAERRGSPPLRASRNAASGIPVSPRSSLPPIPFLSGLARLHLTLPHAPAGSSRRAERHDGKGNLYFVHAA